MSRPLAATIRCKIVSYINIMKESLTIITLLLKLVFEIPRRRKGHFVRAWIAPTCKMHMKVTFEARRESPQFVLRPNVESQLEGFWSR